MQVFNKFSSAIFKVYRCLWSPQWASSFLLTDDEHQEKKLTLLELKHALARKPGSPAGWLLKWADEAKASLKAHRRGRVMGPRGLSLSPWGGSARRHDAPYAPASSMGPGSSPRGWTAGAGTSDLSSFLETTRTSTNFTASAEERQSLLEQGEKLYGKHVSSGGRRVTGGAPKKNKHKPNTTITGTTT